MNRAEAKDIGMIIKHDRRVFLPRRRHLVDEIFRNERRYFDTCRVPLVITAQVDEANGVRLERLLNFFCRDFQENPLSLRKQLISIHLEETSFSLPQAS